MVGGRPHGSRPHSGSFDVECVSVCVVYFALGNVPIALTARMAWDQKKLNSQRSSYSTLSLVRREAMSSKIHGKIQGYYKGSFAILS
jgi:hypothetical protein